MIGAGATCPIKKCIDRNKKNRKRHQIVVDSILQQRFTYHASCGRTSWR